MDLLRDTRCTVHSAVSHREGSEGEFKVYGRAVEVSDLGVRRRYADALCDKIGWRPEEPEYHLFSIDIENASFAIIDEGQWVRRTWRADSGCV